MPTKYTLRALFLGEETELQNEVISVLRKANAGLDFANSGLHALSLNHTHPYDLIFLHPESKLLAPLSVANFSILLRYSPGQGARIISMGPTDESHLKYFDYVLPAPSKNELKMWLAWPKNLQG